jgi:hypothetical protein
MEYRLFSVIRRQSLEGCSAPLRNPCCYQGLECSHVCETDFRADCLEHPVDGVITACDPMSGTGCGGPRPICCQLGTDTYCSDHPYRGGGWMCSGPDASTM